MNDNVQFKMNEYLPLRDVVFTTLREAILKGELKPGERLMEIQLANRLGVSRTPVREAIRKLELEGLVVMIPRKGAEVAEITVPDIEDVLEVREALEELAVKIACRNIQDDQLKRLKKASVEFRDAVEEENLVESVKADMAFHEIIYEAAQNKRLVQLLNNLREQMYRYRMEYLKDSSNFKNLLDEHDAIRKALKKRDEEKAGRVMKQHIQNQKNAIISSIKEKGTDLADK